MKKNERGLGRGLDALFGSSIPEVENEGKIIELDIDKIVPRPDQPRQIFDKEKLEELASSIKENGVLQPILVRPREDRYEIIAGERRYRAAKMAGLEQVPAVIKEIDDEKAAEIALIENLQREDLNIIEEARALRNMIDRFGYTQEELSRRIGKSRAYVANTIRLLNLPGEILKFLEEGKLTAGHARAILALENKDDQLKLAQDIMEQNLSVRRAEKRISTGKNRESQKQPEIADLEERLQNYLGTKAKITKTRRGGKIEIAYYSEDDLQRILELWGLLE